MRELIRQGDSRRPETMPRISERYRVNGVFLEWEVPRGGVVLPNRTRWVEAELIDLSVAGALVRAPRNTAIRIGMRIPMKLGGEEGLLEVRNVRPDDSGDDALYGVVFHTISDALRTAIYDSIARLRDNARLQRSWNGSG